MDTGKTYLESFTDNTPAAGIAIQTPLPKRSKIHQKWFKKFRNKKDCDGPGQRE
jgi:5,10-methylene-tetrahydrofolate dehydrogenase/methenyl tetrahydrofolate cyclohydrolase